MNSWIYRKVYRPLRNRVRWAVSARLTNIHLQAELESRIGPLSVIRLEDGESQMLKVQGPCSVLVCDDALLDPKGVRAAYEGDDA